MPAMSPAVRTPLPYGPAFAIEDLLRVQIWSRERGLRMVVALDHVMDDAEFEEVLVLLGAEGEQRSLTLWRTQQAVFTRTPKGVPRRFATVAAALAAAPRLRGSIS